MPSCIYSDTFLETAHSTVYDCPYDRDYHSSLNILQTTETCVVENTYGPFLFLLKMYWGHFHWKAWLIVLLWSWTLSKFQAFHRQSGAENRTQDGWLGKQKIFLSAMPSHFISVSLFYPDSMKQLQTFSSVKMQGNKTTQKSWLWVSDSL